MKTAVFFCMCVQQTCLPEKYPAEDIRTAAMMGYQVKQS